MSILKAGKGLKATSTITGFFVLVKAVEKVTIFNGHDTLLFSAKILFRHMLFKSSLNVFQLKEAIYILW